MRFPLSLSACRKLVHCFGLVCITVLFSGCAFSKTPVKIVLSPKATQPLSSAKAAIQVGEVKDDRTKSDPRAVWQKANAHGTTSGAFVADRPVSELFREAIEAALRANSFNVIASETSYELKTQIMDLRVDGLQTGMLSSTVVSKLSVRFELFDKATGNSVWRDTLVGKTEDKPGWGGTAFVEKNFKAVAEDVLNLLVADRTFRKFFEQKP